MNLVIVRGVLQCFFEYFFSLDITAKVEEQICLADRIDVIGCRATPVQKPYR